MSEYPKVIRVGMLSVVVESAEEEARFTSAKHVSVEVDGDVVVVPISITDDVSPEPQTYVPDAPVPVVEEPKKKLGSKKK